MGVATFCEHGLSCLCALGRCENCPYPAGSCRWGPKLFVTAPDSSEVGRLGMPPFADTSALFVCSDAALWGAILLSCVMSRGCTLLPCGRLREGVFTGDSPPTILPGACGQNANFLEITLSFCLNLFQISLVERRGKRNPRLSSPEGEQNANLL